MRSSSCWPHWGITKPQIISFNVLFHQEEHSRHLRAQRSKKETQPENRLHSAGKQVIIKTTINRRRGNSFPTLAAQWLDLVLVERNWVFTITLGLRGCLLHGNRTNVKHHRNTIVTRSCCESLAGLIFFANCANTSNRNNWYWVVSVLSVTIIHTVQHFINFTTQYGLINRHLLLCHKPQSISRPVTDCHWIVSAA